MVVVFCQGLIVCRPPFPLPPQIFSPVVKSDTKSSSGRGDLSPPAFSVRTKRKNVALEDTTPMAEAQFTDLMGRHPSGSVPGMLP